MPEAEARTLRAAYAEAGVVLEYGAGGSTLLAAGLPGRVVFAVENDPAWCARLQRWFEDEPPQAEVHLHQVDTGPVGNWGMPLARGPVAGGVDYAVSVWDRPDFRHPDVVLIDGRFRLGCLLTTAVRIRRPVTVLFDDYGNRPEYHAVESFVQPVGLIGRMALFDLVPQPFPVDRLGWFAKCLTRAA
jgi:hypothetical protein